MHGARWGRNQRQGQACGGKRDVSTHGSSHPRRADATPAAPAARPCHTHHRAPRRDGVRKVAAQAAAPVGGAAAGAAGRDEVQEGLVGGAGGGVGRPRPHLRGAPPRRAGGAHGGALPGGRARGVGPAEFREQEGTGACAQRPQQAGAHPCRVGPPGALAAERANSRRRHPPATRAPAAAAWWTRAVRPARRRRHWRAGAARAGRASRRAARFAASAWAARTV